MKVDSSNRISPGPPDVPLSKVTLNSPVSVPVSGTNPPLTIETSPASPVPFVFVFVTTN